MQATSGATCWGITHGYDPYANLLTIAAKATHPSCVQNSNLSVGTSTANQINNSGFVYDAAGNLTMIPKPGGLSPDAAQSLVHVTLYQYDVLDNLLCVHQKSNDATADKACSDVTVPATWRPRKFSYNSLSQLLTATNPESGAITYTYDNNGNLYQKTDARSITITHSYDALNRLTGKTYSNGDPAAAFTYDVSSIDGLSIQYPVGRLVKSAQGSTRTVNSYDVAGRIISQWQCTPLNCGTSWYSLAYTYNYAGAMLTYTDGAGHTFTQTVNAAAQLTQLTSSLSDSQHPGTLASNFSYNPAGAVAQMMFGNGVYGRVDMNNRLQPCRMRTNPAAMSAVDCAATDPTGDILQFKYGFTDGGGANNGNVASWSATGSAGQSFSRSYTYDELNRLKTMSSTGTCTGLSWTYDIWANRTHQTTTGGTCNQSQLTINTANRIADTGYSYDAAGNLTAEPGKTYQYDAENRMKSINGGGTNPEYTFNAEGRRVRKKASGTTTEYVYDLGGSVVAEFVGTTWTKGYVYIGGQLIAQYDNTVTPATTYFAHKDHLGSTRLLTRLDKSPLETPYDYLPFGEPIGSSGAGTTHKFTGKERDTESGLDCFGARYYASTTGRFGAADLPFIDQRPHNPQSWNLYAYSRNNPLNFIDPTGNSVQDPKGGFPKMEGGDPTDLGFDPISAPAGMEGGEEAEGANSHALRILAYSQAGGNPLVVAKAIEIHNQVYRANQTSTSQQVAAGVCSVEARQNIVGIPNTWGNRFTRSIAQMLMHIFRIKHMSWSVTDTKGDQYTISGGPDDQHPGMLASWVDRNGKLAGKAFWRAPQSHGLCSAVDAMVRKGSYGNWPHNIPYRFFSGPNSNSSFNAVGAAGGMPLLAIFWTPGARKPIP